jgi:hypothetical protein
MQETGGVDGVQSISERDKGELNELVVLDENLDRGRRCVLE